MVTVLQILFVLALIVITILIVFKKRREQETIPMPENFRELLNDYVKLYQQLDEEGKEKFEERVEHFLSAVKITGVNAIVEDLDRILIAAGAIIPVYAIPDWQYINLHEVLLYPGAFNQDFDQGGSDRPIAGMVGTGAMQRVMILSQHALRQGFLNKTDKNNTGIHEFVHLVDKTDGDTDGIPEILLQHQYTLPWLDMMHKNIAAIMHNKSDINPYGATNQAEFFAVVSEYFFERPDLLQSKHPELYDMLEKIFSKQKN